MKNDRWLFLVMGLVVGAVGMYGWGPRLTQVVEKEKPVITERVVTKTDTQIAYVPKETVVYKDGTAVPEDTDVQADIAPAKISVKLNEKDYKFGLLQGETQKFESGKILLTQSSGVTIDLKVPTVDRTKNNSVGVGSGSHGLAIMATQKSSWQYFDKKTKAGGVLWRF